MNKLVIFALGAAAGALVTWKFVENKYKKLADEEIESVIERFNNRLNEIKSKEEKEGEGEVLEHSDKKHNKKTIKKYRTIVENEYDSVEEDGVVKIKTGPIVAAPYTISPDEFAEFEDYERRVLSYCSDGILADEDGVIIGDIENIIGDALNHFDEFVMDTVYVRDEYNKVDYEVVKYDDTYDQLYGKEES